VRSYWSIVVAYLIPQDNIGCGVWDVVRRSPHQGKYIGRKVDLNIFQLWFLPENYTSSFGFSSRGFQVHDLQERRKLHTFDRQVSKPRRAQNHIISGIEGFAEKRHGHSVSRKLRQNNDDSHGTLFGGPNKQIVQSNLDKSERAQRRTIWPSWLNLNKIKRTFGARELRVLRPAFTDLYSRKLLLIGDEKEAFDR
jgi:hypothetical protein